MPILDAVREEVLHLMTSDERFIASLISATDKPSHMSYRTEAIQQALRSLASVPAAEGPQLFACGEGATVSGASPLCACQQRIHDIDDAELDHATHYWRGGATIPQNARLAHRHCNRARGGR